MTFGERLKTLRLEKNITAKDLGKIIYKAESTVSHYENDNRTPDFTTLKLIANYFQVSTDYLLGITDDPATAILSGDDLPKELQEIGIEYLEVAKELKKTGLSKEQIKKLIDFAKSF